MSRLSQRLKAIAQKRRKLFSIERLESRLALAGNVVSWWPGDGNYEDAIGPHDAVTTAVAPTFVSGQVGQAMLFGGPGSGTALQVTNEANSSLNIAGDLTIEAWVKLSSNNSNTGLVSKGNFDSSQGEYAFGFLTGSNQLTFRVNGAVGSGNLDGQVVGTTILSVGQWYHVAAVYDQNDGADSMQLYVNGVLDGSSTYSLQRIVEANTPVVLGAYLDSQHTFAGALDETAIYNRALTVDEISAIVSSGAGGKLAMASLAGTYSSTGLFPGALAPLGYFVPLPGATTPTPAPAGSYVDTLGATSAKLAEPGYYAPGPASTNQIAAQLGSYVPTAGASAPTLATPGHYVDTVAATAQKPSPAGSYIPGSGASSLTQAIVSPAGYYAPEGSAAPIISPAGYFAPTGSGAPTISPAGYYAPEGSGAPIAVQAGYYAPEGSGAPILCPEGYYAPPLSGAPIITPPGTFSPEGASAPFIPPAGYTAPGGGGPSSLVLAKTLLLIDGNLFIDDLAENSLIDNITLSVAAGGKLRFHDPDNLLRSDIQGSSGTGTHVVEVPQTLLTQLSFVELIAGNGSDTFKIDFSSGNPIPGGGVRYRGGTPREVVGDTLLLTGGATEFVSVSPDGTGGGAITLLGTITGSTLYEQVETIQNELNVLSDFGDAPAPYPQAWESPIGLRFGTKLDSESSAQVSANADGDDTNGIDDEDGITIGDNFVINTATGSGSVTVTVSNGGAYVEGWIDFDGDQVWEASEVIFHRLVQDGDPLTYNERFLVPAGTTPKTTFARFRASNGTFFGPAGAGAVGEVEDYKVTIVNEFDYGDAPAGYPLAWEIPSSLRLGTKLDSDPSAQVSVNADGDDVSGIDDEDGVVIGNDFVLNAAVGSSTLSVTVSNGASYVEGWIDFNGDQVWDSSEVIFRRFVLDGGQQVFNEPFNFPAGTTPKTTFARFRVSNGTFFGPVGGGAAGEVEDYRVTIINESDFGDAPAGYAQASELPGFLRLGTKLDSETSAQVSPNADGDDTNGIDDEDGVTIGDNFVINSAVGFAAFNLAVSNGGAYVEGWIDFNGDQVWDTSERIFRRLVQDGDPLTYTEQFNIPEGTTAKTTYARFRVSNGTFYGPSGGGSFGEIEDYQVTIINEYDFGDAPAGYPQASEKPSFLRFGTKLDGETSAQVSPNADGDDTNGIDDEDGVTIGDNFVINAAVGSASFNLAVSNGGAYVEGWIDFNGDQVWDTSERIFRRLVQDGDPLTYTEQFVIPQGTTAKTTYARFRASNGTFYGPSGLGSFGEIEDYKVTIVSIADFGDAPQPYLSAVHLATGSMLGITRDTEASPQFSSDATGDGADEDGIATPIVTNVGKQNQSITITTTGTGMLDAWIDFNGDGSWGGIDEHVFDSVLLFNSVDFPTSSHTLTFDVPSYAKVGTTFARFRLSSQGGLGAGGLALDGEVEDYAVQIGPATSATGTGAFTAGGSFAGSYPTISTVYAADIDGDGDVDSITAAFDNGRVAWQANDGQGGFGADNLIAVVGNATSAVAADIDGDGDSDVLASSFYDNSIRWYMNVGRGVFVPGGLLDTAATQATRVYAADIDADGDMDVLSAVAGIGTSGGEIRLYVNGGQSPPAFSSAIVIRAQLNAAYDVSAADVNGDGRLDILSVALGNNKLSWYENLGGSSLSASSFAAHDLITTQQGLHRVLGVDLDRDGDTDMLASSITDGRITWYRNDNNQFVSSTDVTTNANGVRSIEVADLDGDNDYDVLASLLNDSAFVWYRNDGSQPFTRKVIESSAAVYGAHTSVPADLDGDGDLDVLAGSYYAGTVRTYRQVASPPTVTLSVQGAARVAENSGQTLTYRFARSGSTAQPLTVNFSVMSSAIAGLDYNVAGWTYNPITGVYSVVIPAGSSSADVVITPINDQLYESDDVIQLVLNISPDYELGEASMAQTTITNDDPKPAVEVTGLSPAAVYEDSHTDMTFQFTRTGPTDEPLFIQFGLGGSASVFGDEADYRRPDEGNFETSWFAFFDAGQATTSVVVRPVADTILEPDETIEVSLRAADYDSYVIGVKSTATATILNDEFYDFGDAPAPYPTLLTNNGASHIATGPTLGSKRDAEIDGQPTPSANGDGDDEDGVELGAMYPGQPQAQALVTVHNANPAAGVWIDGWIDFNGDGSWTGAEEKLPSKFVPASVELDQTVPITFTVPSWARSGTTYARFRVSSAGGLGPSGQAADGEVEDYSLVIAPPTNTPPVFDAQLLASARETVASDMNGDGKLDTIRLQQTVVNGVTNWSLAWFANLGEGIFDVVPHAISSSPAEGQSLPRNLKAGQFFGDGQSYVSFVERDSTLTLATVNGVVAQLVVTQFSFIHDYVFTDLDSDGDTDVALLTSAGVYGIERTVTGWEERTIKTGLSVFYGNLDAADIDRDGDSDLVYSYLRGDVGLGDMVTLPSSHITAWLSNNGNGTFNQTPIPIPTGQAFGNFVMQMADVDSDSYPDVVMVSNGSSLSTQGAHVLVSRNSSGNFLDNAQLVFATGTTASLLAMELADFNGDGTPDVVLATSGSQGQIKFYSVKHAQGSIFSDYSRDVLNSFALPGAADLDNDADLDILTTIIWSANRNPDFGDAPDVYHTSRASNGPQHDSKGPKLGFIRNGEFDAVLPLDGTGDDGDDGVVFEPFSNGSSSTTIHVRAANVVSEDTYVNGWIDFNGDGDWDDAGEHVLDSLRVIDGENTFLVSVPSIVLPGTTYARFRIAQGLIATTPDGFAKNGEVEDYALTILNKNATVQIPATASASDVTLRLNGPTLELYDNLNGAALFTQAYAITESIAVYGRNNQIDRLTVDHSFGGFMQLSVWFDAGSGVGDALVINGTGSTLFDYLATSNALGSATINADDWTSENTTAFGRVEDVSILNALSVAVSGALNVGNNTFTIDSQSFTSLDRATTLGGGSIIAPSGILLGAAKTLVGFGSVVAPILAERGSTITATGTLTLGDVNAQDGIELYGRLNIGANTVTLNDAHQAILGSQTTIGTAAANGRLIASNGMLIGSLQALSGRGTISTPGDRLVNQGFVQATATGLTFTDLVTGAGSFAGNVTFSGGTSFGNSPTITNIAGNAVFAPTNTATVEIGGTTAGTTYDKVVVTGNLTLGGNLVVQLIDLGYGFVPKAGNSFVLFSAAVISGSFANVTLPSAPSGTLWKLNTSSTQVSLSLVPASAPTVVAAEVNGNTDRQRSMVQTLKLTFSSQVNLLPGAIEVRLVQGVSVSQTTPVAYDVVIPLRPLEISVVNGRTVVVIRFADAAGNELYTLGDGKYKLKIFSDKVIDALNGQKLDGDFNNVAGGDYSYRAIDQVTATAVDYFYRLYGDYDGDRDTDNRDYLIFARAFSSTVGQPAYLWYFDVDGDGVINSSDLTEFNVRRNKHTIRL